MNAPHDEHLRQALRHAPDAAAQAPAEVSQRILSRAHAMAGAARAGSQPAPWWVRAIGFLRYPLRAPWPAAWRAGAAGGFAVAMVGFIWLQGGPLEPAQEQTVPPPKPASPAQATPANALAVAPKRAEPEPEPHAAKRGPSLAAPTPVAPTPAAPPSVFAPPVLPPPLVMVAAPEPRPGASAAPETVSAEALASADADATPVPTTERLRLGAAALASNAPVQARAERKSGLADLTPNPAVDWLENGQEARPEWQAWLRDLARLSGQRWQVFVSPPESVSRQGSQGQPDELRAELRGSARLASVQLNPDGVIWCEQGQCRRVELNAQGLQALRENWPGS